jgi:hypothetical protein
VRYRRLESIGKKEGRRGMGSVRVVEVECRDIMTSQLREGGSSIVIYCLRDTAERLCSTVRTVQYSVV